MGLDKKKRRSLGIGTRVTNFGQKAEGVELKITYEV